MKEKEVGEVFEFEGVKLQVQIDEMVRSSCCRCYFENKSKECMRMKCLEDERTDGRSVIFKEIK